MSYSILGRAIKTEYLALGTLLSTVGLSYAAMAGGSKQAVPANVQQAKESVKIEARSKDEEELINSIKNFIAEAEKSEAKH